MTFLLVSSAMYLCYYPGAFSLFQVSATPLIWRSKSIAARSSNELQWLETKKGHRDSNPAYDRQGDMP